MKALFHTACGAIRSPAANGAWTYCECTRAAIRWTDPSGGIAQAWCALPDERDAVRIIGFNNMMLTTTPLDVSDEKWRRRHELNGILAEERYLFSKEHRDCWAVLFRVGDTGDVTWAARPIEGITQ